MEQLKKLVEWLKKILNGQEKKKLIENTVIIIIIGIIAIIAGSTFLGKDKAKSEVASAQGDVESQTVGKIITQDEKRDIEKEIEAILSQINGAGKVSVMITYAAGKELVPASDIKKNDSTTQEKDTGGGSRSINQSDYESKVVYEETQGGNKKPIVLKEMQPEVRGVVVVADGASDVAVRESLSKAVQVLVDVPLHKIQVFQRNR